jgi:hypothetical protein
MQSPYTNVCSLSNIGAEIAERISRSLSATVDDMTAPLSDADLTEFTLGFDRFEANAIVAECEHAGLRVEALMMDDTGHSPGLAALQPHRLLVRNEEAAAAAEIVQRWIPTDVVADNKHRERTRQAIRVVAAVLILTLVGSLLAGAVSLL